MVPAPQSPRDPSQVLPTMLKLYAPKVAAGATALVITVLAEKQIPFELIELDMHNGAHKAAEYVQKQHPFGQVPSIDDAGFIVYESRAICRYLVHKYPDQGTQTLIPPVSDLEATARFEQAASVELANFHPHAHKIYMECNLKPRLGWPADPGAGEAAKTALNSTLDVYESILGKQKYLAGDTFTLVDIFHLGFGPGLKDAGFDGLESKGPNVRRWWKDVSERPTFTHYAELQGWAVFF
ncbi:Glutathione S-transferase-like protein [Mycena kentingensis (nom. inval.)]|nr:Glutathione S-transferase-like protein [Mycena kentingensis (nom. inval.)]